LFAFLLPSGSSRGVELHDGRQRHFMEGGSFDKTGGIAKLVKPCGY
jgi:hypothetical protein